MYVTIAEIVCIDDLLLLLFYVDLFCVKENHCKYSNLALVTTYSSYSVVLLL